MGLIVDTNVFIAFEKEVSPALDRWDPTEKVFASVITVSELLVGVHRANTDERRRKRSAFVEAVIAQVGILDLSLAIARVHARLGVDLAATGKTIGSHDLIIAATALHHDYSLLTMNVQEFSHVPGLKVVSWKP